MSNRSSFPSVEQPVQNDKEVLVRVVLRGLRLNIQIIHSLSVRTYDRGIHENIKGTCKRLCSVLGPALQYKKCRKRVKKARDGARSNQ